MQSHCALPGGRAHGSLPTVSLWRHLLDGGQRNAPRRQGSCHRLRPRQRAGHLRCLHRQIPIHHPRVCSVTRQDWLGKCYDGDGIGKTLFHPGIAPPAMRTTLIAGEVGRRACYTPTAGNPCSMDIPVPIGAQPHIWHNHQSPQEQTSRGDCKPTINGSRELNGGRQVSSQVQPHRLRPTNREQQEYWLLTIKAARMAGVICQQRHSSNAPRNCRRMGYNF
jgi:hypothetical protein